ncbi:hypothetical protein HAX54_042762 [Datura stramonium]|uniref:Pentatricopeptide repeat-containing protein n=1 Tax=Datura stramonium TaxID=4076 RepID=A0ABS8SMF2_DATST|nr:hypothetical protein [Datura stramonium]
MKLFDDREVAFAFFKYVLQDYSESTMKSCCISAHLLAAGELRLLAQDILSWIIRRVGKCRSDEVVELMWREHYKYESDFSVLDSLMRAFLTAEMISDALEILSKMRDNGLRPSSSAISILFKLLLRIGDYDSVWKLFRDMLHKGPRPTNNLFNVMILGYCRKGRLRTGESLFHLMRKFGCEPDVFTYNILINAYCIRGWTSDALNWVHMMAEHGCNPSISTFSTVINALCKEGNVVQARKLFDGMQEVGVFPSTVTYNALMDGYVKAREIFQASMLYEEMKKKGVAPDAITFNILVSGHYKYGREEDGDRLLWDLTVEGLFPDYLFSDVSIAGLCWAGRLNEAVALLDNLLEKGIPTPSASTCASLLMSLSMTGRLQEARDLMAKMVAMSFPINITAYTVLLDGGNMNEAQKLERDMRERGLLPDVFTINTIINGFCKQGRMKFAIDSFVEMQRSGLQPDIVTYNILINGFCKAFDVVNADNFMTRMYASGWEPDITTYNIRLHGFCSIRRINRAVMMLDELVSAGVVPNTVTYNTMMNSACNDILDRAMILAAKLLKMAFIPNTVTANLLLSHLWKQGLPQRTLIWGQKLSEIGFEFDEITHKILDKASHYIQENTDYCTETTEKSLFLDFLMYITYDYIRRSKAYNDNNDSSFELVDTGPLMLPDTEAGNRIMKLQFLWQVAKFVNGVWRFKSSPEDNLKKILL